MLTCSLSGFAALACPNRTEDCCLRCEPGAKDDQPASSQMSACESRARRSQRPSVCLGKPRGKRREHPGSPALGFLSPYSRVSEAAVPGPLKSFQQSLLPLQSPPSFPSVASCPARGRPFLPNTVQPPLLLYTVVLSWGMCCIPVIPGI